MGTRSLPPTATRALSAFPWIAGALVTLIGAVGLVSWIFDLPLLRGSELTFVTMKANTAAGLFLGGLALLLHLPGEHSVTSRRLSRVCAALVGLLGFLTIGQYVTHTNLGIDELLLPTVTELQNRMGPNTAVTFFFVGLGLLGTGSERATLLTERSLMAAGLICLVALCGYAYGVPSFYGPSTQLPMALVVAAGLLLLCTGTLAARPERRLMVLLTGDGAGSQLARRFLPVAILLPIAEGWLRLEGERAGLYSREFGVALFAVATVMMLSGTALWSLRSLNAAEAKILQAKDEAEAANTELEAFSYSVSHDLRAPLRGIDGFSQALLEDCAPALDDQGKDYLARIRAGAQRMGLLIDDLLKLSGVTRSALRHIKVDLSALSHEVIEEFRLREPSRQVEIVVKEGLSTIGDQQLLKVALVNLVGNAWKFTSRKAQARIEVGQAEQAFFVRDNGAGFDMQYVHKLFGAFQRLHPTADFPGTGIGLATVQRVIRRHGGRVWAEGVLEQGTTIYFTLEQDGGG